MFLLTLETDGHVGDYSVDMKMIVKVLSGKIFGQGVGGAFCYQNHSKPYTSNFEGAEAEAEAEAQTPFCYQKHSKPHLPECARMTYNSTTPPAHTDPLPTLNNRTMTNFPENDY